MSAITIEAAQANLDEAQASVEKARVILEQVKALTKPTALRLPEICIELQPGERYVGPVLDADGKVTHHLVLMATRPSRKLSWGDAMAWADGVGGQLPTRQEQALLFANCRPHLDACWHWSSQEHEEDASSAWYCNFSHGTQGYYHESYEGSAVAVRRLTA